MMKIGKVLVAVFAVWFPACAFAQTDHKFQMPAGMSLPGDAGQWDFGNIQEGSTVRHSFVIKNDSDRPLTILKVNTSCGCTASEVKKKTLAPGESTEIDVSFNSTSYNGWVQQFIFVNTDNLNKPFLRYIIRANVIAGKGAQKKE